MDTRNLDIEKAKALLARREVVTDRLSHDTALKRFIRERKEASSLLIVIVAFLTAIIVVIYSIVTTDTATTSLPNLILKTLASNKVQIDSSTLSF